MAIEKQIWISMLMEGFYPDPQLPRPFGGYDTDGGI